MSSAAAFEFDFGGEPRYILRRIGALWVDRLAGRQLSMWSTSDPEFRFDYPEPAPDLPSGLLDDLNRRFEENVVPLVARLIEEVGPAAESESAGSDERTQAPVRPPKQWVCILDWYFSEEDMKDLVAVGEFLVGASSSEVYYYRDPGAVHEAHHCGDLGGPPLEISVAGIRDFPPDMSELSTRFVLR